MAIFSMERPSGAQRSGNREGAGGASRALLQAGEMMEEEEGAAFGADGRGLP